MAVAHLPGSPSAQQSIPPLWPPNCHIQPPPNSENLKQVTEGSSRSRRPRAVSRECNCTPPALRSRINPPELRECAARGVCKLRDKAWQKESDWEVPAGAWFPGGAVVWDAGLPSGMRGLGGGKRGLHL